MGGFTNCARRHCGGEEHGRIHVWDSLLRAPMEDTTLYGTFTRLWPMVTRDRFTHIANGEKEELASWGDLRVPRAG